ncbi:MAG: di-heme oxidoredictase family protein [Planctomycetota bacterium]
MSRRCLLFVFCLIALAVSADRASAQGIGEEVAVPSHLSDGEEFQIGLSDLLDHGARLFSANWTIQEGGQRPQTKGVGNPLSDPTSPLTFPRNFNRISAPDANSCAGCHNAPFGMAGGGGDIVANVFVLGQRFDFATFDGSDFQPTRGAVDELGNPVTLQSIANSRATLGMFGSGFIEMLARQITEELQALRDSLSPGGSVALASKGIDFGILARNGDGTWDTTAVDGLPAPSLTSSGAGDPPNLIVRPFHQAGAVISLRQFTNNAYNHHHGIQADERFGANVDADGDGYTGELTIADVTAASVYQAILAVPGRVIPNDPAVEEAVRMGEDLFVGVGCASCHTPCLPLDERGWIYSEPNPFNPPGNLRPSDSYVGQYGSFEVNLLSKKLPEPRLRATPGRGGPKVHVPAFTDFKLHDITSGPGDPNREALDMQEAAGSAGFFAGNSRFLTRKLWGVANEPPYYHHGLYTTLREAVEAHAGEAAGVMANYSALSSDEQNAIIEFLKTLQVLPPGTKHLIVDEKGHKKPWREFPYDCGH